ncbi:MAG: hypothetical protein JWR24_2768, partial [Actinoallomurus sp.]|nr:hypothetical protein [Actinoallomurus sp.]
EGETDMGEPSGMPMGAPSVTYVEWTARP